MSSCSTSTCSRVRSNRPVVLLYECYELLLVGGTLPCLIIPTLGGATVGISVAGLPSIAHVSFVQVYEDNNNRFSRQENDAHHHDIMMPSKSLSSNFLCHRHARQKEQTGSFF